MNKLEDGLLYTIDGSGLLMSIVQTEHVFQIIQLVLSIFLSLLTTAYIIYKWHKRAKADGHITKDELKELGTIIVDTGDEVIEKIDNYNKK